MAGGLEKRLAEESLSLTRALSRTHTLYLSRSRSLYRALSLSLALARSLSIVASPVMAPDDGGRATAESCYSAIVRI